MKTPRARPTRCDVAPAWVGLREFNTGGMYKFLFFLFCRFPELHFKLTLKENTAQPEEEEERESTARPEEEQEEEPDWRSSAPPHLPTSLDSLESNRAVNALSIVSCQLQTKYSRHVPRSLQRRRRCPRHRDCLCEGAIRIFSGFEETGLRHASIACLRKGRLESSSLLRTFLLRVGLPLQILDQTLSSSSLPPLLLPTLLLLRNLKRSKMVDGTVNPGRPGCRPGFACGLGSRHAHLSPSFCVPYTSVSPDVCMYAYTHLREGGGGRD